MFGFFMDYVVYPVWWVLSPQLRAHRRYVKVQNAHLDGKMHTTPDPNCWYCRARQDYANRRGRA